jgi:hypothetical protein
MILKYRNRNGIVRNTEKPWYIEYSSMRHPGWSYYRSYKTEDACLQGLRDMIRNDQFYSHKWEYRHGFTDFSTWPLEYAWGSGRQQIESLIIIDDNGETPVNYITYKF